MIYTKCPSCGRNINLDRLLIFIKNDIYYTYKYDDFLSTEREFKKHYNSASTFINCGECSFTLNNLFLSLHANIDDILNTCEVNEIIRIKQMHNLYLNLINESAKINNERR